MNEHRELRWVEAARTVAMALVILVHANILGVGTITEFWPFRSHGAGLMGASVPVFMCVAGLVAARASRRRRAEAAAGVQRAGAAGARARWARFLAPFVVWNAAMMALQWQLGEQMSARYVLESALGGTFQLYFLLVLAQLQLAHGLIERFAPRVDPMRVLTAAGLVTLGYCWYWERRAGDHDAVGAFGFWGVRTLAPWALFYAMGALLGARDEALAWVRARWHLLALASAPALWVAVASFERVMVANGITSVMGYQIVAFVPVQVLATLALLGGLARAEETRAGARVVGALAGHARLSFAIYLNHMVVLLLVLWGVRASGLVPPTRAVVPVVFALTWAASAAIARGAASVAWPAPVALVLGVRPRRGESSAQGARVAAMGA